MTNLYTKHQRIRARGKATLCVSRTHPFFVFNGNTFKVLEIDHPNPKCRIRLAIKGKVVKVGISDVL